MMQILQFTQKAYIDEEPTQMGLDETIMCITESFGRPVIGILAHLNYIKDSKMIREYVWINPNNFVRSAGPNTDLSYTSWEQATAKRYGLLHKIGVGRDTKMYKLPVKKAIKFTLNHNTEKINKYEIKMSLGDWELEKPIEFTDHPQTIIAQYDDYEYMMIADIDAIKWISTTNMFISPDPEMPVTKNLNKISEAALSMWKYMQKSNRRPRMYVEHISEIVQTPSK